MPHTSNLVWLDLEMTGLNPEHDRIIQIATIVTDSNLNIVAEGPEIVLHQGDDLLATMDEWNTKQHNNSGLVTLVRESCLDEKKAEHATLEFLRQHVAEGKSPLCGNSIWQ